MKLASPRWLSIVAVSFLLLCPGVADACEIRVFAAASLTDVIDDIIKRYNTNASIHSTTSDRACGIYGGSSALARQIEHGAPAQIFISANRTWVNYLIGKKLVDQPSSKTIATNRLVLASHSPQSLGLDPTSIDQSRKTLALMRIGIGEINSVPVGIYGAQALRDLNLIEALDKNLIYADNVRTIVTWLLRNEIDLGIIYESDLLAFPKLSKVATFPATSHDPIHYLAAIVRDQNSAQSMAFYDFLTEPDVQRVFEAHGFGPLETLE